MIEIETDSVEFKVFCSCGAELTDQAAAGADFHGIKYVAVEPCQECFDTARDEARHEGFNAGYHKFRSGQ